MNAHTGPVVIGVDGSSGNAGAVLVGVEEARRLGVPALLVHVIPDYVAIAPMMPIAPTDLTDLGAGLLRQAEEAARAAAPDVEIETQLRHGTRTVQLAAAARGAALLVVGQDDRPLIERLLRGNTATGVAARATCPVVAVPGDWRPATPRGVVVAAVKSPSHSAELLADAFAQASARKARLVVLHSWRLSSEYDDVVASRLDADEWIKRSETELETLLVDWRRSYPGVEVEVRVEHDYPVHGLCRASQEADLLILVRRARGVPAAIYLGGTARGVLRSAGCPVRVVPPATGVDTVPGLVLEQEGTINK